MIAPLSWLKEYVDIDCTPQELEDKLFSCGFEVEELHEVGEDISNVVVGPTSAAIGFTIGSLGVRAKTGATIAAVDRDGKRIRNVGPAFKLRAGDVLIAMGDRLQISQLRSLLEGGI